MAKRKRHTAAQIIRKLEDADRRLTAGQNIAQVCQALEVSEATYHRWRNQYGGMKATMKPESHEALLVKLHTAPCHDSRHSE